MTSVDRPGFHVRLKTEDGVCGARIRRKPGAFWWR